jgi:hypothetical protein
VTIRQERFSIKARKRKASFASMPAPLRYPGSVVEACVSLERFRPLKSTSALRPDPEAGSSPEPSLGLKLSIEAQALDQCAVNRPIWGQTLPCRPERASACDCVGIKRLAFDVNEYLGLKRRTGL